MTLRERARALERETLALYCAERYARMPMIAKIATRGFESCKRVVPAA